jgi:hypothetical protein
MKRSDEDRERTEEARLWRRCADFPNYEVSRDGQVRRTVRVPHSQQPCGNLRQHMRDGYLIVSMRHRDGVWRKIQIQRLVAKTFLGMTDDLLVSHARHQRDSLNDIRFVTKAQCLQNARGRKRTSSFKGVS